MARGERDGEAVSTYPVGTPSVVIPAKAGIQWWLGPTLLRRPPTKTVQVQGWGVLDDGREQVWHDTILMG